MEIKNTQGLTTAEINRDIQAGGKFIVYQYTISIIVMTFKRSSDVYFIRPGESAVIKGLGFTFISLILGWWGIPWGPIYTIGGIFSNLTGGKDVTSDIIQAVNHHAVAA